MASKDVKVDLNVSGKVTASDKLVASTVGGDEGGEILLGKPETNTTLTGEGVTIDVYQNKLRFFEQGGDARGYYIDITGGGAGVGTNLVSAGGGGGLENIVEDTTPQLGGDLDAQGNNITNVEYITLDTTPATTPSTVGSLWWDTDFETISAQLDAGTTLQIGQEHVIRVKNASGSVAIAKGKVVMFAGATGDTVIVSPAISTSAYEPYTLVGITAEEIPADGFGFVCQYGFVNQIDTDTPSWSLGDLLYVDPSNPGELINTAPSAPNWTFPIAAVTRVNSSSGRILVRAIPGSHLHDVVDVAISSPADNEVLAYNSANGTWINQTASEAGLSEVGHTHTDNNTTYDLAAGGTTSPTISLSGSDSSTDTVTFSAGTGITLGQSGGTITITNSVSDTNTTYDLTTSGTSTATISLVPSSGVTDSFTITGSGATTVSHSAGAITISSTDTDTTYSPGTALDLSGTTFNLDLSELTTSTADGDGDYFVVVDTGNAQKKLTKGSINISGFNGDSLTLSGDLDVNGGDITSTSSTVNFIAPSATSKTINIGPSGLALATINIGDSAYQTAISIGTGVGTTSTIDIGSSTSTLLNLGGTTTLTGTLSVDGYMASGDEPTVSASAAYYAGWTDTSNTALRASYPNASYAGNMIRLNLGRSATTAASFFVAYSNWNATQDLEVNIRGNGSILSDVAATTPADYAEYFEWEDGNPDNEDRAGKAVKLVGNKIVFATENSTDIIGIVSARPAIIGDSAWSHWTDKYLKDNLNREIMEDYQVIQWDNGKGGITAYDYENMPEDVEIPEEHWFVTQQREKINPDYDPEAVYVPREDRQEWSPVGLLGKLRVFKGQPVNPNWIKMRDIDEEVEEWLVR